MQLVKSQPDKTVNCIAWSPQGHFLVLGGLKAMQGQLEFFNADDFEVRLCVGWLISAMRLDTLGTASAGQCTRGG